MSERLYIKISYENNRKELLVIMNTILPISIRYRIKHINALFHKEKPEFSEKMLKTRNRILYLDSPNYPNIGDQALAIAMRKFMADFFPEYTSFEVLENNLYKYISWLKKHITDNDIICLNGGGNMGSYYKSYKAARRLIIKEFRNNIIIIFPQTIDYENNIYGTLEKKRSKKIYSKASNLIICAREEKSYENMKALYNKNTVLLCPDIVLYLDYRNLNVSERSTIGVCLRNDIEGILPKKNIDKMLNNIGEHINITTTPIVDKEIDDNNRHQMFENTILEFSKCKLIITDRLHGMIFSFITNTPCIALPNSNGKIKGVYKWIANKGSVLFVENIDDVYEKMISMTTVNNENISELFKNLDANIRSKIKEQKK